MEFVAKRRTLSVSVDDQKYTVKFPTIGRMQEYRKDIDKKDADAEALLRDFLSELGLPVEAQSALEIPDQKMLIELLTDQKK